MGVSSGLLRSMVAAAASALPLSRYVVDGPSMEPAYRAGDRVLVNRLAYRRRPPVQGDVIVLRDPEEPRRFLLKRVAAAPQRDANGAWRVYVLGDNAAFSRDSRTFGAVPQRDVIGRAWRKY